MPIISRISLTMLDLPLFWYLTLETGVAITALLAKRARKVLEVFIVGRDLKERIQESCKSW